MTTTAPAVKAKRGDLIVIHTKSTNYGHGSRVGPVTTEEWDVGVVTSITREGLVKRWRHCEDLDPASKGREIRRGGNVQGWQLVPQADVDVPAALATAACHVWPGHEQPRRYGSVNELREALRPHLLGVRDTGRQAALSAAAATWLQAREAAAAVYREAAAEANRAHAQAGYHTRDGDAQRRRDDQAARGAFFAAEKAANDAYRTALAGAADDPQEGG